GVTTLCMAGVMPATALMMNWLTWWIGDTLGVWIFTTIGMIAFADPRKVWQKRWRSVAIPLVVSFTISIGVFWLTYQTPIAWAMMAGAFLFTSLLGSVLLVSTGSTALVEETVTARTNELKLLNASLDELIAQLEVRV